MTDTRIPRETAALIADRLGETEEEPRRTILRVVKDVGAETALSVLEEVLAKHVRRPPVA
jgi:hypothetical protein